jgi:hypothetical protein
MVFETRHARKLFCSPKCAYRDRVAQLPARRCLICEGEFRSLDPDVVTCSYRCGWAYRKRQAGVQPDR